MKLSGQITNQRNKVSDISKVVQSSKGIRYSYYRYRVLDYSGKCIYSKSFKTISDAKISRAKVIKVEAARMNMEQLMSTELYKNHTSVSKLQFKIF